MNILRRVCIFALISFGSVAFAGPIGGAIQGSLYTPGGGPVTSSNVNFKVQVMDKNATCVLYEEIHLGLDLSGTNGDFSFDLGYGSSKTNNVDGSAALKSNIFRNDVNIAPSASCPGGVTITASDPRAVRVLYDVSGGSSYAALTPDMKVLGTPYSVVAETLQGKAPSDFISSNESGSYVLNQANVESIFTSSNYTKLLAILAGSSSVDFNNQRLINIANPTSAQDASTKNYADTTFGGKTLDTTGVGAASGDKFVMYWDQAAQKWVAGLPNDASKLPLAGGTMTGPIAMGAQNITNIGHMTMALQRTLGLGSFTDAQETTLIATPLTAADAGKFWYNSDHGVLKVWNGSAAVAQAYTNGSGQVTSSQLPANVVLDGGNAATAAMNIGNTGNFGLNLKTNNVNAITIDNTQKVGLGTATPATLLHVYGTTTTNALRIGNGGDVTTPAIRYGANSTGIYFPSNTSMTLVTNNSAAVSIDSSGNVGIGSSTPTAKLDIVSNNTHTSGAGFGTSTVTNYQPATNPAASTIINNNYTYLNTLSTANLANVSSYGGNYTNQHLGGSNLAAQYGMQAATIHNGTGTVALSQGIQALANNGSTGTVTSAAAIAASVTNSGGGTITTGYGVQIGNIEASTKYGLYQSDTSAKNYFGGKVGIGTTTPTAGTTLDIYGTGTANSSVILPRDTTAGRPTGVNGMVRYNSSTDKFEAYEGGAWTNMTANSTGFFNTNGNFQLNNNWLSNDGGNEGIRIDNNGKVAVGTSTPNAAFDVRGALASAAVPVNMVTYDTAAMAADVGAGIGFGGEYGGGSIGTFAGVRGGKENGTASDYAGYLSLMTRANGGNLTEKIRITSAGRVGIGTSVPGAKLAVTSTNTAYSGGLMAVLTDSAGGLKFYSDGYNGVSGNPSTVEAWGTLGLGLSSYQGPLILYAGSNAAERMRITATGYVGIGTNNPGQVFEVNGNAKANRFLATTNGASTPGYTFNSDTDSGMYYIANDVVGFTTGSTERMRIDAGGRVGIGVVPSSYTLDVNGTIRSMSGGFTFPDGTVMTTAGAASGTGTSSTTDINFVADSDTDGTGEMIFISNGTERMRITNSGLIGIGTTTPGGALDVSGMVRGYIPNLAAVNGAHTSLVTTINVNSTSGYPSSGILKINGELIKYTGTTATSFTGCTRGFNLTTPGAIGDLATVDLVLVGATYGVGTLQKASMTANGQFVGQLGLFGSNIGGNWTTGMATGTSHNIFASYAIVGGSTNIVSGSGQSSFVTGTANTANSTNSIIVGSNLTSNATAAAYFGRYNKPVGTENAGVWQSADPLMVLGNGSGAGATSNALMVFKDGKMLVNPGATVAVPTGSASLTSMGTTTDSTAASLNATDSAGSSKFYVRNDGNIGVGVTNPSEKLEVAAGGNVKMGHEVITSSTFTTTGAANCSAGKQVLGGGCNCNNGAGTRVIASYPSTSSAWTCVCDAGPGNTAYAICANMK